jgi:hypothetical protein
MAWETVVKLLSDSQKKRNRVNKQTILEQAEAEFKRFTRIEKASRRNARYACPGHTQNNSRAMGRVASFFSN